MPPISYYTALTFLTWVALVILCTLVGENDRLSKEVKRRFYVTYLFIFISSVAEWAGVQLNGNTALPTAVLLLVKYLDYLTTPLAGAAFIGQMQMRNIWSKILQGIIAFNVMFQTVSLFTGWMTVIDKNHIYSHGPLYFVYILEYLSIIVIVIIQFLIYGKRFKRQNRLSLYLIMALAIGGIALQESFGSGMRTAYVALTLAAALMFIHTSEFFQQRSDEHIRAQQQKISTDALTGLLSRHAYQNALADYRAEMPANLTVFSIDINGLKSINDTLGHEAGDELIRGAAACIDGVFGKYGTCYRTGGDEFIVFTEANGATPADLLSKLKATADGWQGKTVPQLRLSAGYAARAEHPEFSCEELLSEADQRMYQAKSAYYQTHGIDRINQFQKEESQ